MFEGMSKGGCGPGRLDGGTGGRARATIMLSTAQLRSLSLPVPALLDALVPTLVACHETLTILAFVFLLRSIVVAIAVVGIFIPIVLLGPERFMLAVVLFTLGHAIAKSRLKSWTGLPISRPVVLVVSLTAGVRRATVAPLEAAFAAIVTVVITGRISLAVAIPVQFVASHRRVIAAHRAVIIPALHVEINLRAAVFTPVLEAVQVPVAETVGVRALWPLLISLMRCGHSAQRSRHNAREAQPDKLLDHFVLLSSVFSNRPPAQVHLRPEPDDAECKPLAKRRKSFHSGHEFQVGVEHLAGTSKSCTAG